MVQHEVGKKYYRIDSAVWNAKSGAYDTVVGKDEYESEQSARTALGRKKLSPPDVIMFDLYEIEYDRYGCKNYERRILVKDEFGTYKD